MKDSSLKDNTWYSNSAALLWRTVVAHLCMKSLGISGVRMHKAAWIEVSGGQAVLTVSFRCLQLSFVLPSSDTYSTCYSLLKLLWWNIVNSYYTGMPDSMIVRRWEQIHPSDSAENHAEWLVCTDIQRSQRGRTPFAQPCIPHHTLWPNVVPFLFV